MPFCHARVFRVQRALKLSYGKRVVSNHLFDTTHISFIRSLYLLLVIAYPGHLPTTPVIRAGVAVVGVIMGSHDGHPARVDAITAHWSCPSELALHLWGCPVEGRRRWGGSFGRLGCGVLLTHSRQLSKLPFKVNLQFI